MAEYTLDLVEQLSDLRSDEIAYKLSIENKGPNAIRLLAIAPFLPDSVVMRETKSASFAAVSAQRDAVTRELDGLVQLAINLDQTGLVERQTEIAEKQMRKLLSASGFFKFALRSAFGDMAKKTKEMMRESDVFRYTVETYSDAIRAKTNFIDPSSLPAVFRTLFELKLEKLLALEKRIGGGIEAASLATILPNSKFSTTYVLQFKRRLLTSRKYNLSFEVDVAEESGIEHQVSAISASLLISPHGAALNCVVSFAALMGFVLKAAIDPQFRSSLSSYRSQPGVVAWPAGAAVIIALVFFNAYEFTNLAEKVKMALSWRSALLIGVICGLTSERFLAALEAFVK